MAAIFQDGCLYHNLWQLQNRAACVVDVVPVFYKSSNLLDRFLTLVLSMEHVIGVIQALGD